MGRDQSRLDVEGLEEFFNVLLVELLGKKGWM